MLARIGTMNLGLSKYICLKRTSTRVAMWASWYSNLEYKCSANKRREEHAESALTSNNNLLLEIVECQCVPVSSCSCYFSIPIYRLSRDITIDSYYKLPLVNCTWRTTGEIFCLTCFKHAHHYSMPFGDKIDLPFNYCCIKQCYEGCSNVNAFCKLCISVNQ